MAVIDVLDGGLLSEPGLFETAFESSVLTKTFGAGAGMAADLQYWDKTARQIRAYAQSNKIIVEKSTLPVKTAQAMKPILPCEDNGIRFDVLQSGVSGPEDLFHQFHIGPLREGRCGHR